MQDNKSFCTNCGKPLPFGASFCPNCGAKINNTKINNNEQNSNNLNEDKSDLSTKKIQSIELPANNEQESKVTDKQVNGEKKTKRNMLIICGCVVLLGIIAVILISSQNHKINVDSVSLDENIYSISFDKYKESDEIVVTETLQLQPIFSPIDETAKVKYSSDNETVAEVDKDGIVTAISEGTAVITATVTDTIYDTVTITVIEDTPYNRLTENERTVVDLISKISYQFKNPDSINVTAVSKSSTYDNYSCVEVCISAQNGFGGYTSSYYLITEDKGKLEITNMDDYYSALATFNPIENIDIDGINEALHSK